MTKNHLDHQTQVRVDHSWSSRLDVKTQHFPNRANPKCHGQVWANNKVIIKSFNLAHELSNTILGVCWVTTPKYKNIRQFNIHSWWERFILKINIHTWLIKDFAFENGYLRRIAVECGKCWLWFSWSWLWPNLELLITITTTMTIMITTQTAMIIFPHHYSKWSSIILSVKSDNFVIVGKEWLPVNVLFALSLLSLHPSHLFSRPTE